MRKFILLFFILFNLYLMAQADVVPYYTSSLRRAGIGFSEVTSPLVMKREPKADGEILETLREVLALDPRPSYHNDPRREYGMSFAGFNVKFRVDDQGDVPTIYVTEIL